MNGVRQEQDNFFFWLKLEDKLDEMYLQVSQELSRKGIQLIPVTVDQISKLAALTNLSHLTVICSTRHSKQFMTFRKSVHPILKYLLRQEKLTFFNLSSFSKLEIPQKTTRQNYFFLKYPLNLNSICDKLIKFHEIRLENSQTWPGGKRAKVPGAGI